MYHNLMYEYIYLYAVRCDEPVSENTVFPSSERTKQVFSPATSS